MCSIWYNYSLNLSQVYILYFHMWHGYLFFYFGNCHLKKNARPSLCYLSHTPKIVARSCFNWCAIIILPVLCLTRPGISCRFYCCSALCRVHLQIHEHHWLETLSNSHISILKFISLWLRPGILIHLNY